MRSMLIFLFILISSQRLPAQPYLGPKCLGPFCVEKQISTQTLENVLGTYSSLPCCFYRSKGGAFLRIESVELSDELGTVAVSTFPEGGSVEGYAVTDQNLAGWKTKEGVGLGSSEESVIAAYGAAGEENQVSEARGGRTSNKVLIYKGKSGQYTVEALFATRDGKVISAALIKSSYAGPDCLGPFCMGLVLPGTWARGVLSILRSSGPSKSATRGTLPYCFQTPDGGAFVEVDVGHGSAEPEGVFVSDFVNCDRVPLKFKSITGTDLIAWKTPEGIGINSLESDVLRAYGKADDEGPLGQPDATCVLGRRTPGNATSEDKGLVYRSHGLQRAEFGIKKGRVASICLSNSE